MYKKMPRYLHRKCRKSGATLSLAPVSSIPFEFDALIEKAKKRKLTFRQVEVEGIGPTLFIQEEGITQIDLENFQMKSIHDMHEKVVACLNRGDSLQAVEILNKYSYHQLVDLISIYGNTAAKFAATRLLELQS